MLPTINLLDKNPEFRVFICNSKTQVIGRVKEADSPEYDINTGSLNEFTFTIPLYIDDLQNGRQQNGNADLLINRAIILVKYGTLQELFLIDNHEDSDDTEIRTLHCFSLGYQLNDKYISGYTSQGTVSTTDPTTGQTITSKVDSPISITQALTDALQKNRSWAVGYIDPALNDIYRSFSVDGQTALEFVYQIGQSFGAIITWDTFLKKINAYHPDNFGIDKGFKISDKQYITNLVQNATDDEFCTRLFLTGNSGLTVDDVNPSGQSYIEDYSYFMSNGQMSQDLINSLVAYNNYLGTRTGSFPSLLTQLTQYQTDLTNLQDSLTTLQTNHDNASNLLDIAKASTDTSEYLSVSESFLTSMKPETFTHNFSNSTAKYLFFFRLNYTPMPPPLSETPLITFNGSSVPFVSGGWQAVRFTGGTSTLTIDRYTQNFTSEGYYVRITDDDYTNQTLDFVNQKYNSYYWDNLIAQKNDEITAKQTQISGVQTQIDSLQSDISIENHLTTDELNELDAFIIEKEYSDDNIIDSTTLLSEGQKQLQQRNQPQVVYTVTLVNFLNSLEEKRNWDKLSIFDTVRIQSSSINVDIKARVVNIKIDKDNLSLTIANTKNVKNAQDKFIQLLYGTVNSTKTLQKKEYTWDKASTVHDDFNDYINSYIDATKQKIVAGINENVTLDQHGMKIINTDDPNVYLVANHGVIAITKDGGKTWDNALTTDGLVAEKVIGKLIAGSDLEILNNSGTVSITGNGITITGGALTVTGGIAETTIDSNATTKWNNSYDWMNNLTADNAITPYEKKGLRQSWDSIVMEHNSYQDTISYYWGADTNWQFIIDYNNYFNALNNYLNTEIQSDNKTLLDSNNTNNTTLINYTEFDGYFNNYYTARATLKVEIEKKAKNFADSVQQNLDNVSNEIVYSTKLYSSAGTQFKNGNLTTTISVRVWKGSTEITDTLPNSAFVWRKTNESGVDDTAWNGLHNGVGKSITVTDQDVLRNATFWCDIDIQ